MIGADYFSRDIAISWMRFTSNYDLEDGATRPEIARSWQQCHFAGVDPFGSVNNPVLNKRELEMLHDKKRNLIDIARSILTNLCYFIAGSGFVVMLSDEQGYIMDIMGDNDTLANAGKYNLSQGANWAEKAAGTNGIGTALATQKPIQVSGAEHYCQRNHFWTCSAAPIFDKNKQIIGVLQMSGPALKAHLHTLGMVVAAVESISSQLKAQKTNRELTLLNHRINNILFNVSEGIIVTDEKGLILLANSAAEKILLKRESELKGSSVTEFIAKEAVIKGMLTTGQLYHDLELTVKRENSSLNCLSSGMPIKDDLGHISGGLIYLKPLDGRPAKLVGGFSEPKAAFQFENILGKSEEFKKTIKLAKIAAGNSSHVLLQGESGTGKEVLAQGIHNSSSRRRGPFVAINCGAIPRELIGSELFGYEGGSFTGAKQGGRPGKFELASGGTLFLDEIGDMPLEQQVALLRVLQDQCITRIGGDKTIRTDVRIICASNKNLRLEAAKGNFREDLFFRLNVILIPLPPLRQRREDIPLLFNSFFETTCRKLAVPIPPIDPGLFEYFKEYDWPGNVRELQNVVERMVNLANGQSIGLEQLPEELLTPRPIKAPSADRNLWETIAAEKTKIRGLLEQNEYHEIMDRMFAANWNLSQVAREMGISRTTLYKKMKKLNITH